MFDNLGAQRQFPETISITLDFNQALIDDTVAEYSLFFDRTIRNSVDATFVVTAGAGSAEQVAGEGGASGTLFSPSF